MQYAKTSLMPFAIADAHKTKTGTLHSTCSALQVTSTCQLHKRFTFWNIVVFIHLAKYWFRPMAGVGWSWSITSKWRQNDTKIIIFAPCQLNCWGYHAQTLKYNHITVKWLNNTTVFPWPLSTHWMCRVQTKKYSKLLKNHHKITPEITPKQPQFPWYLLTHWSCRV